MTTLSLYNILNAKFGQLLHSQFQRKSVLVALSHAIEDEVIKHNLSPVIFAAFQDIRYYNPEQNRYDQLRATARTVKIFGRNLSDEPVYETDWFVVINEARFKVLLACRQLDEVAVSEKSRTFEGYYTYEPQVVDYASEVLAAHSDEQTIQAVKEINQMPHDAQEQFRFVSSVSDRILAQMENTNRQAIEQINRNQQLLSDLQNQTKILQEIDLAKIMVENERDSLHHELKLLYIELTRSQTVMTQAVVDKTRLDQNLQQSSVLFEQLREQLEAANTTSQLSPTLTLLTQLQQMLGINKM